MVGWAKEMDMAGVMYRINGEEIDRTSEQPGPDQQHGTTG